MPAAWIKPVPRWLLALCTVVAAGSLSAPVLAIDAPRVDVPISQTVLPNGDTRYSVPVTVGDGAPIEAALDTGSFGLRVLSRALDPAQYEATPIERHYAFGSGARFNGVLAKGEIGVGGAKSESPLLFQLIQSVDCTEQKPKCPASRLDAKDYRIAGSGFSGLGYDAILGVSLRRAPVADAADNPLGALGAERWIVALPRPGQLTPGHLIVNPAPEEVAGFTLFHLDPQPADGGGTPGWKDTALPGCLVNETSKERLCGATLLDSGAPGFAMNSSKIAHQTSWPEGTSVRLQLQGADKPVEIAFKIEHDAASKVSLRPGRGEEAHLSAGSLPYYSYAVLYDRKNGILGMKARDDGTP